jgi:hypothetical protein
VSSSNETSIDRGITALTRAAGALVSIPAIVAKVELTTNADHLVPPTRGNKAYLSKTPQVVVGGRRWRQLRALQGRSGTGIRSSWKGAIAGQIFAGIRESFARAGVEAPKLGAVRVT